MGLQMLGVSPFYKGHALCRDAIFLSDKGLQYTHRTSIVLGLGISTFLYGKLHRIGRSRHALVAKGGRGRAYLAK